MRSLLALLLICGFGFVSMDVAANSVLDVMFNQITQLSPEKQLAKVENASKVSLEELVKLYKEKGIPVHAETYRHFVYVFGGIMLIIYWSLAILGIGSMMFCCSTRNDVK